MASLPLLPHRMRMRAAILSRRGSTYGSGTGLVSTGVIDRDLAMHPTREAAEAATIALADDLDLIAVEV